MEDIITIDYQLLPIIENIENKKFKDVRWFTEYLCSRLRDYTITKDALLLYDIFSKTYSDFDFHGMIHIYSQEVEEEFKVKYTDGKLISIVQIIENCDKHWQNCDLNDFDE